MLWLGGCCASQQAAEAGHSPMVTGRELLGAASLLLGGRRQRGLEAGVAAPGLQQLIFFLSFSVSSGRPLALIPRGEMEVSWWKESPCRALSAAPEAVGSPPRAVPFARTCFGGSTGGSPSDWFGFWLFCLFPRPSQFRSAPCCRAHRSGLLSALWKISEDQRIAIFVASGFIFQLGFFFFI